MLDLLVIGTEEDPHVDKVANLLGEMGYNCLVLDAGKKVDISLNQSAEKGISIKVDGSLVTNKTLIWDRSKLFYGSPFYAWTRPENNLFKSDIKASSKYRVSEWRHLFTVIRFLHPEQTINNPYTTSSDSKILQQFIASEVGFLIPPTLVSTNKDEILEFVEKHKLCILKSFSGTFVEYDDRKSKSLMTASVSPADISNARASQFSQCPHFLQKAINKKYELRVFIFDGLIFPFKINSQDKEYTKIDWRYGNFTLDFTKCQVPDNVKRMMLAFMNRFDISTGSIDIIVDEDDSYWFLECNYEGAWGWLDIISESAISKDVAAHFAKKIEILRNGQVGSVNNLKLFQNMSSYSRACG